MEAVGLLGGPQPADAGWRQLRGVPRAGSGGATWEGSINTLIQMEEDEEDDEPRLDRRTLAFVSATQGPAPGLSPETIRTIRRVAMGLVAMAAAGACAVLLVGRALGALSGGLLRRSPPAAGTQGAGMWEALPCERCPVGSCYRASDGGCKRWEGGYYCYVAHCSLVPQGVDFSGCWHWRGEPHYTVNNPEYPCQNRNSTHSSGNEADDNTTDRNAAPNATLNATSKADVDGHEEAGRKRKRRERRGGGGGGGGAGDPAEQAAAHKPHGSAAAQDRHIERGKQLRGNGSHNTSKREESGNSSTEEATPAGSSGDPDPRLAAYWDAFACGPAGDDHRSAWCGGPGHRARCREVVPVDEAVCVSGQAHLASLVEADGNGLPRFINGCLYFYLAQYACLPPTTTTTTTSTFTSTFTSVTTTVTSTSTTTTTTTGTSTSTTTTTTTSTGPCTSKFTLPKPPLHATDLNGIHLPNTCFGGAGPHHVFVIGDWGGLMSKDGPRPARQRPKKTLVDGVDDTPQQRVAEQMRLRAATHTPDYVLNVGDNFYWAGIEASCGSPAYTIIPTGQFEWNFEKVYRGPGLEDKPWLGVLGNHDYGGFLFSKGWDQLISYSWGPSGRWVMPAQYWRSTVHYPDVSVDYFFVDTNALDAEEPHADPEHNICSLLHNPPNASCGAEGPTSVWDCPGWFQRLWEAQKSWLEEGLPGSYADWQVIVTHFPPVWAQGFWKDLADRHGIDLIVTGHMHRQVINNDPGGFLYPTAWIVSGGGGGITSEDIPSADGNDDQYGFFDLAFSKEVIEVQGITHGGQLRSSTNVYPRARAHHHLRLHDATPEPRLGKREAQDSGTATAILKKL